MLPNSTKMHKSKINLDLFLSFYFCRAWKMQSIVYKINVTYIYYLTKKCFVNYVSCFNERKIRKILFAEQMSNSLIWYYCPRNFQTCKSISKLEKIHVSNDLTESEVCWPATTISHSFLWTMERWKKITAESRIWTWNHSVTKMLP